MTPNFRATALLAALAFGLPSIATATEHTPEATQEVLQAFVEDFRSDPAANFPVTFGVRVQDQGEWHVAVTPADTPEASVTVELQAGLPPSPSFIFVTDAETLTGIHQGSLNALTAMGRARMSDPAPMDIEMMEGFAPDGAFLGKLLPLVFHFWTRGRPEIIPYGDKSLTREVHGANALVFYYQAGFRSAWFQIEKGQHVNADEKDQINPFPSLLIITAGELQSRIGSKELTLEKGQAVLIPAGVPHEFWQTLPEPAEGILLMFGEGA
jgi:mannose-6-phosphate isomerase-like protein (cupin superfamily)